MSLLTFPIIDPHIHQWDPYHTPHEASMAVKILGRFPGFLDKIVRATKPRAMVETVGLTEYVLSPYLPQNYALDCSPFSVDAVVHIEANWHDHDGLGVVGETRWVAGLPFGKGSPKLGAIVGTADPASPDFENILLAHRAASPLFRGIRRMAAHHPDTGVLAWSKRPGLYVDPAFLKGFGKLAQHGLSFDAWAYSVQLPDVTWLASRFPEVPFVINHLATPVGVFGPVGRSTGSTASERAGIFSKWQHDIAMLAEHKHVHAKVSGLLMPVLGHTFHKRRELADIDTIVNLLAPFVEHAVKVFGYERLIFASNFPMDKVTARLPDIIEAHARLIAPYGDVALKAIFRENARRFYSIDARA
jgi:predicted TIM-barrel fold metal-dependent hydrolase